MRFQGDVRRAHVVSYELINGTTEDCVLHTCDNRLCVNPKHLFSGTHTVNMRDRDQKGRQAKGERINLAVLTETQVLEIRAKYMICGYSQSMLARDYQVSKGAIAAIVTRRTWKHL